MAQGRRKAEARAQQQAYTGAPGQQLQPDPSANTTQEHPTMQEPGIAEAIAKARALQEVGSVPEAITVLGDAVRPTEHTADQYHIVALELMAMCRRMLHLLNKAALNEFVESIQAELEQINLFNPDVLEAFVANNALISHAAMLAELSNGLDTSYNSSAMPDVTTLLTYEDAELEVARRRGLSVEQMRAALDAVAPPSEIERKLTAAKTEALARGERGLARSIDRHREDRAKVPLPEGGYTNPNDASDAARFANNFGNLQKRLKAAGMEPLPPDDRARAAWRLSKAFFRAEAA